MTDNVHSDKEYHIGTWTASIKTGRKAILVVHGVVPTNGEKPPFSLRIAGRQGTDPLTLVLELRPDVAVLDGPDEVDVYYSEVIDAYDQYDAILVRGVGRNLAIFDIEES